MFLDLLKYCKILKDLDVQKESNVFLKKNGFYLSMIPLGFLSPPLVLFN